MEALPSCVVRVDVVELGGLGLNRSREGRGHHKLVLAGVDWTNRPLGPGRFSEKKLYMCTLYTTYLLFITYFTYLLLTFTKKV